MLDAASQPALGLARACVASAAPRSAPPQPSLLNRLTLRLGTRELEEEFWAGQKHLVASVDSCVLLLALFNLAGAIWTGVRHVRDDRSRLAMMATVAVVAVPSILQRLWLGLHPESYLRHRHLHMTALRVLRACWMLSYLAYACGSHWGDFLHRREVALDAAEGHLAASLASLHMTLSLQAVMYALAFRVAAPLQAAVGLASCWAFRPMACAVLHDPMFAAAAVRVCHRVQGAKRLVLALVGGAAAPLAAREQERRLCEVSPMELLLPLYGIASTIAPLCLIYAVEARRKLAFLRSKGHDGAAVLGGPGVAAHLFFFVALLLGAFVVAEGAAQLGRPYSCGDYC